VISVLAAVLAALLAPPADEVLLKDGRLVRGTITGTEAGVTRLRLGRVEIPVPEALIDRTWVEALEGYVPRTPAEEEALRRGWVLFEGNWMSRTRREERLKARAEERKAAIDAAVLAQQWSHAAVQETRHFVLTSNASEALRAECARRLEAIWRHAAQDWGVSLAAPDAGGKLRACVYRTYEDYRLATGRPARVRGFDDWIARELHVWFDPRTPEDGLDILNHEVTHLLVAQIDPGFAWPAWLNEGLAECYGSATVRPDGTLVTGAPQFGRLATLRAARADGRLPRLRDVLLTAAADFHDEQYAVSWSFVRFLLQSPRHGRAFRLFFATLPRQADLHVRNVPLPALKGATQRVPEPADVAAALERRLSRSLEQLEDEWLRQADQEGVELTPQASYEAARRAMLEPRSDGRHTRMAVESFEAALAAGSTDARCWRDYAEFIRKGGVLQAGDAPASSGPDLPRALSLARRAIELDPLDPYNYLEAAGCMLPDGPAQDLDTAAGLCDAAEALSTPEDPGPAQLLRELRALIEPALARRAAAPPAAGATSPPRDG